LTILHRKPNKLRMTAIRWKPIPQLAGKYEASNQGDIRHAVLKKPRKLTIGRQGYAVLCVWNGTRHVVHRAAALILSAFVPRPTPDHVPNHKNAVKHDNRLKNLEWVTAAGNRDHAHANGLYPRGDTHPRTELTTAAVHDIRARASKGEPYATIGADYNLTKAGVSGIVLRRTWKHV
jgi:hypothetical protein